MLAPRFQLEVGSRLELEEAGVWYPVRVIREDPGRVLVHFEGWSPRHDRWINRESQNIRARRRQMMTRKRRQAAPSAAAAIEDDAKSKDKDTSATSIISTTDAAGKTPSRERRSTTAASSAATAAVVSRNVSGDSNQSKDNKDKDSVKEVAKTRESRTASGNATRTGVAATPQRRLSAPLGGRRSGQQLKVGGVFSAGIRRTPRRSVSQAQEKESPLKDVKDGKDAASASSDKEAKDAKIAKASPETVAPVNPPTVTPPVGWAYEVVTKAEDLVPKKAFTINEDHNEFKCPRADCNKGFRKEKLLASHLKHYHNLSDSTDLAQTKPPSPKRGGGDAGGSEDQPPVKRRRGRRSRTEIEEALRIKEQQEAIAKQTQSISGTNVKESKDTTVDLGTESSSSTDISNATIVDHSLDQVESQQAPASTANSSEPPSGPLNEQEMPTMMPSMSTTSPTSAEASGPVTAAATSAISTATPTGPTKTTLYGRVGQNRFVPIPEPLVLGREKRKVVKTERMQEAEGVLLRRATQPRSNTGAGHNDTPTAGQREATNPKEHSGRDRRRRSHPDSTHSKEKPVEEVLSPQDETIDVTLRADQAASDDDDRITTPAVASATEKPSGTQSGNASGAHTSPHGTNYRTPADNFIEKDMVHCMCNVDEESGLMMQCDICLCWQHGSCFGIESEQLVPERYVCVACANARRVWAPQAQKQAAFRAMTEGRLPGLAPGLPVGPSPRFINLARVAEVMARLKRGMRGVEQRVERIACDSSIPAMEKRILLAVAAGDVERAHRQLDACERIVEAIDRPAGDGGACGGTSEALILRSTVKSVLKDLAAVQRLTLYK